MGGWRRNGCGQSPRSVAGFSLVELLCACLLLATLAGIAIPVTSGVLSRARSLSAARYLAARMQSARGQAVARGTHVAVRVTTHGVAIVVATFRDGNRNGVRTTDIADGSDARIEPDIGLSDLFPGVRAGSADGGPPLPSSLFSFGPSGTASSGTVYLKGSEDGQYAVRVFGATGKVRVLTYRGATGEWVDVR